MKLNYFPTCYPDEDIRSISYRYHLHSGNRTVKQSTIDLFELTHRQCIIPKNISILFERLPQNSQWSSIEFLQRHSFYPIFRPFLNDKHRETIEISFTDPQSNNGSINLNFSTLNNNLTTANVRYCPTCLLEDYERFGECYVHRLHQIIDLDVCHKHHTALTIFCPKCFTLLSDPKHDILLATPYCEQNHLITKESLPDVDSLELKLALLKDYEFLLTYVNDKVCNDIRDILKATMIQRIPNFRNGLVSKKKFIEEFSKCISVEMQNHFQISKELMMEKPIFRRLLKANLFLLHPNLFMLMVHFLAGSMETFFSISHDYSESGLLWSGPWECLNKICPHYQERVITEYKPFVQSYKYIKFGAFTCDLCGFTYSLGWDTRYQKIVRFRVRDRGMMWKKIVLDHFHSGLPLYKIANIVGAYPAAVQKAIAEMNTKSISKNEILNEVNVTRLQVGATLEVHERIAYHRERLLHKLEQNPNITRTDVKDWSTISWLRAHDRDWYDQVLPIKRKPEVFDYDELDNLLVLKIREAVKKVNNSKPNRRILKDTIINMLDQKDQNRLRIKKQKLPKSWNILELNVENLEEYLIRKLPNLILSLQRYGIKKITWFSIEARFKLYKNASDRVKEEFEKLVIGINQG
ncbi:TnsD family Tn7-like transposition protein [Paenibacillus maysiensis]|uniref:TnsD family Tn7-like transposition protein n=1 Tax=Paenibacillus maysiensis TaxID=1155954 RepID=UPI002473D22A|nr:TnsD family Tn7-like transposition protein [Paenibacillus maysiensis]